MQFLKMVKSIRLDKWIGKIDIDEILDATRGKAREILNATRE